MTEGGHCAIPTRQRGSQQEVTKTLRYHSPVVHKYWRGHKNSLFNTKPSNNSLYNLSSSFKTI